jgi:hypothetical protein
MIKKDKTMSKRKKYKVGDRIFFECLDGTIGTEIVLEVEPKSYIDDNGRTVNYDELITWRNGNCSSSIEDYNTLPLSGPRVKELQKQLAKQDNLVQDVHDWIALKCSTYPDYYDNETIAAALGQVAKEYGYEED